MRKLFLDDTRKPPDFTWDVVRNYEEFVAYITLHGVPDIISFDHDLGFEHYPFNEESPGKEIPYDSYNEKTGYHCAQWLVENHKLPKQYLVHSMNMIGKANIEFVMDGGYRRERRERNDKARGGPNQSEVPA
jgi:NAD+-processing family protein with receiver domain